MKRPSFQFYPDAWLSDISLRAVSSAARGLWIDMICLMHQGCPYGHLKLKDSNGGYFIPTQERLAKMTGNQPEEIKTWLADLEECGVLGHTKKGVIFSRKMVRDERQRLTWKREKSSQRKKTKDLPGSCVRPDVRSMSGRSPSPSPSPSPTKKNKRGKPAADEPPPPSWYAGVTWSKAENKVKVIEESWREICAKLDETARVEDLPHLTDSEIRKSVGRLNTHLIGNPYKRNRKTLPPLLVSWLEGDMLVKRERLKGKREMDDAVYREAMVGGEF